jgi:hypothetical protein
MPRANLDPGTANTPRVRAQSECVIFIIIIIIIIAVTPVDGPGD